MQRVIKYLIFWFLNLPENPLKKVIREVFYGEVITERIVEYAMVFANLNVEPSTKTKILDIGCYYSNFPIQLASMGYSVEAIDLMDYQLTHPNFKFIKGDITKSNLRKNYYNIVTCISTLEHIGIKIWGDNDNVEADSIALEKIYLFLKKGGRVIVTVPFGKTGVSSSQRSYDADSLKTLFKPYFRIKKMAFYKQNRNNKWLQASLKDMKKVDNMYRTYGMALIIGVKS